MKGCVKQPKAAHKTEYSPWFNKIHLITRSCCEYITNLFREAFAAVDLRKVPAAEERRGI